ncbi:hypothetical protein Tco_0857154 [Tanacetum coccineum]|uniref:Ubiquitin-like protease family profile domain-containing protein n=1 Tax=Tanacetum coccineum TaxID=301880 RepID=A0ABQ5B7I7_9ASTR
MFETGSYKSLPEHIELYEALEASMERAQRDEFFADRDKSCKRRRDDQGPPPPLDYDLSKKKRHDPGTSGSSQPPAPQSSVWKTSNTRDAPSSSSKQQSGPHSKQPVKDIPMPETANIYDSEDTGSAHLPKITLRPEWFKPIPEEYRPIFEGQAYEVVKAFYPNIVHLQFQMEEYHKMLTNQNDWTNLEGDKVMIDINRHLPLSGLLRHGRGPALSISKMKAARYHDFGLELLIPEHMWINDVCTYDISASYGISHCVVSIKAYSRYGYDYLKEITLHRADYQEYTIAEKDFKNLYPSGFEDLNLLLLQGHLNHLPGSDKRFEYKHNYIILDSPHAVVFPISNNEWKIMMFNEIYKFSDGTLTNILEALDYRVKEYMVNQLNPGVNVENRISLPTEIKLELEQTNKVLVMMFGSYEDGDGDGDTLFQQRQVQYEHVGPQDTRPQDGERSQDDDQRLDLADDLKKAQDHISSINTSHMTKITTSMYKIFT